MSKITFKNRKEATEFLKEKGIDTSNWSEEKWQSLNKSQAEIHIQALAEAMWDAKNKSVPEELSLGEWHIPFGDKMSFEYTDSNGNNKEILDFDKLKIATARCARLSYMTFDGDIDYEKDIKLHDRLLESKHLSPFEHCAKVMTDVEYQMYTHEHPRDIKNPNYFVDKEEGWCNNFKGFIPYRYLIENE